MNRLWKVTYGELGKNIYDTEYVLAPDIKSAISKVEIEYKENYPNLEVVSAKLFAEEVLD